MVQGTHHPGNVTRVHASAEHSADVNHRQIIRTFRHDHREFVSSSSKALNQHGEMPRHLTFHGGISVRQSGNRPPAILEQIFEVWSYEK
jgi:hypothetical protein